MEQQNDKSNYTNHWEKHASPYHIHVFNFTAKDVPLAVHPSEQRPTPPRKYMCNLS